MNRSRMLLLAALLLASAQAGAAFIPGYPDSVEAYDPRDVALLPRYCKSTQLFALAESLGAPRSLVCHPPTMTHASVEPEVRKDRGIGDGLVRLSVGLEDAGDLISDINQALEAAGRVADKRSSEAA